MKLAPPVVTAEAVAVAVCASPFIALPVPEGGRAVFCKGCGAELRLEGGTADATDMKHAAGCGVGRFVAGLAERVFLHDPRASAPGRAN